MQRERSDHHHDFGVAEANFRYRERLKRDLEKARKEDESEKAELTPKTKNKPSQEKMF